MPSAIADSDLQVFIGYFEEPEPGVPDGCTGWYHTAGKFPLRSAEQVFTFGPEVRCLVRDDVAGPFDSRDEAAAHLATCLNR